ncbi:MAG: molybdopterin-dependent oxidoreductase [Myxococcales bacterium]|nr:molybdopterin-dependent oxidoreductase [Myxococcales bacterium]
MSDVTTHTTFCRICEALCGLEVDVDTLTSRVVDVRPDRAHTVTEGFACIKGTTQHEMYASPDRLGRPLARQPDGSYAEVSWDDALQGIGGKVRQLRRDHGPQSIAMYVGTAAGFSALHPIFAQGFMTGVGSTNMFSSATQDCANKFAVARQIYGFPFLQPFPDLDHTDCLIIVGANPAVSKWSFGQVSNPVERLKGIVRRGGQVITVDPRRTETAKVGSRHCFIRPNTDVFFFAAFLHELIRQGGVDEARVAAHTTGMEEIRAWVAAWTPERSAVVTKLPADDLRELVTAYRTSPAAALYSSTGVNMGQQGALSFWLQEVINAVSGNLDRRGGTVVGRGVLAFPEFAHKRGILMRQEHSRVGGFGSVNDTFPGGILADEITREGTNQIRALFVTGGNPLITMAGAGRLREAFENLELLVVLDLVQNETASVAHYVLPCTSPLERPDLPFVFPLFLGMQTRPYLQATRAMVPPPGEQRDEATIYLQLARASGVGMFGSAVAQRLLEGLWRWDGGQRGSPAFQERVLSWLLRLGGQGSFARLADEPHGRVLAGHAPGDFLGQRVLTEDGRVHLAPGVLLQAARERLDAHFDAEASVAGELKLITKRALQTHNSWTHNHEKMVSRRRRTNYLYIHPDDASARGLCEGDLADVRTPTAAVRVPVSLLADLMPGTVALPHGWGHQHARGLSVASKTTGVNVNLLAASGPEAVDPLSGMSHLTGITVQVGPADGPLVADSWSGM